MSPLSKIYNKVALKNNLSPKLVERVYKEYWKTIRSIVEDLPFKEDITKEEFLKLRPNINITRLGKLYVSYPRYELKKKSYINAKHKEN